MSLTLLLLAPDAAVADALEAFGHRVTIVEDGRATLYAVDRDRFDAVLLEGPQGLDVLRRLREGGRTLPVIRIGTDVAPAEAITALDAGADDHVVAPDAAELDARLRALLRARRWTSAPADTLRAGDIVVSPGQFRVWRGGKAIDLARMELNLLTELARHADTVLTRAMLLDRVWDLDTDPGTNVVDVHIRRLRLKLAVDGQDDPIVTVRGIGYMLRG